MPILSDTDVRRFLIPQRDTHDTVKRELQNGCKISHWMWYTFPQVTFPYTSQTSMYYSIKSKKEAEEFLKNKELRSNLEELCDILAELPNELTAHDIFGFPDDRKLKSSMTLFDQVEPNSIYTRILNKYYSGERCQHTIDFLSKE